MFISVLLRDPKKNIGCIWQIYSTKSRKIEVRAQLKIQKCTFLLIKNTEKPINFTYEFRFYS